MQIGAKFRAKVALFSLRNWVFVSNILHITFSIAISKALKYPFYDQTGKATGVSFSSRSPSLKGSTLSPSTYDRWPPITLAFRHVLPFESGATRIWQKRPHRNSCRENNPNRETVRPQIFGLLSSFHFPQCLTAIQTSNICLKVSTLPSPIPSFTLAAGIKWDKYHGSRLTGIWQFNLWYGKKASQKEKEGTTDTEWQARRVPPRTSSRFLRYMLPLG